jgi:general secretion pathway protein G
MKRRYDRHTLAARGFTLIELLLVVAILGILAAVAVVNFGGKQTAAMINATRTSIAAICTAVDMYEIDTGRYPAGLNGLLQSSGEPNWNGPYLKGGLPADAWATALQFSSTSTRTYEIRSAGPDKQMGNEDDILSFTN